MRREGDEGGEEMRGKEMREGDGRGEEMREGRR